MHILFSLFNATLLVFVSIAQEGKKEEGLKYECSVNYLNPAGERLVPEPPKKPDAPYSQVALKFSRNERPNTPGVHFDASAQVSDSFCLIDIVGKYVVNGPSGSFHGRLATTLSPQSSAGDPDQITTIVSALHPASREVLKVAIPLNENVGGKRVSRAHLVCLKIE